MTHTETIGFCSQVAQFLGENKANLQASGLDVTAWIPEINGKRDTAVAKNGEQDELRVQLKNKTVEATDANDDAYKTASTRLDAAIGVLGKTTSGGKQAAKIRSSINRKPKKDKPKP
jgi:hypothetical protein